ncbi:unnamed protein product [Adineta ricciae]|uniref:Uncharacterized protein n=1 Tax=Adineta ricciae TaxID=249248 RepID=A0A815P6V5_ADIRI|nr:unnamed protein product [Adineta ricciae]
MVLSCAYSPSLYTPTVVSTLCDSRYFHWFNKQVTFVEVHREIQKWYGLSDTGSKRIVCWLVIDEHERWGSYWSKAVQRSKAVVEC